MALPSTRQDFLNFYRAQNPSDIDTTDNGILEKYATEATARGVIDQYPDLKNWRTASAVPEDTDTSRSVGEIAKDTGAGLMQGLAAIPQGLYSLGNVVTGGVANDVGKAAGIDISQTLNDAVNWWGDLKSDKLKEVSRQANNYKLVDWDGTISKPAAEFINKTAFALSHPAYIGDIVAQSLPSFLPVVAAERWGSSLALGLAERTGLITSAQKIGIAANGVEQSLASGLINEKIATDVGGMITKWAGRASLAAIGVTEAGGASSQSRAQVMATPFDTLNKQSPDFQRLITQGFSPEQAREKLANAAERIAFAINLPLAIAASKFSGAGEREAEVSHKLFTGQLEGTPEKSALRELVSDFGHEYTEEFIQSGGGQFAQNVAIQQTANPDQSLSEGVVSAAAEGGLSAVGQSVALQAPRVAGAIRDTFSPAQGAPIQTAEPTAAAAPLGEPVSPLQAAEDTSIFASGDLVNVKDDKGGFSRIGLEIAGVAGEQNGEVVYNVKTADGTVTPVPESQLAVFDSTGAGEQAAVLAQKDRVESGLRDQLVTPDIQTVLRERGGLSTDELASFPAETLLARYREITAADPVKPRPAIAAFRGTTGELQTGAIPQQGIQLNFFGSPEINQAPDNAPPTSVQTLGDYTDWRTNNLRRDAALRFSQRQNDEVDFSNGQTLMDLPGVVRVPDVVRQSNQLAQQGDEELARQDNDFSSQVERLRELVNNRVEQVGPEENFKTVNQLVEQAGGWDARPDLSPLISSYEEAAAVEARHAKLTEYSQAQDAKIKDRVREKLTKAGVTGAQADEITTKVLAAPAAERGAALRNAIVERRITEKAEAEKAKLAQDELNRWIREGNVPDGIPDEVKQQVAAAAVALRSNLAQSLGPTSYAETFAPVTVTDPKSDIWLRITRKWTVAGQAATSTRKAVAIRETDGSVSVRGVFFSRGEWRLAARERGLTKTDAYARIRENLLESDIQAGDATIDRALSEKTERQNLVKPDVRAAIQRANDSVGYAASDNLKAFGEDGYLSAGTGRQVIGFVTAAEGQPLVRNVMRLANEQAFGDVVTLLRSPEINPSWTGSDIRVGSVGSLDATVAEGGATFGDLTEDPTAVNPADAAAEADETTPQIENTAMRPIGQIIADAPEAYARAVVSLRRFLGRRDGARERIEQAIASNQVAAYSAAIEQLTRFPDAALNNFVTHLNADETLALGRETLQRVLADWTAVSAPGSETTISAPEPAVTPDPVPFTKQTKFEPTNDLLASMDKVVRALIKKDRLSVTMDDLDAMGTEELMGPFYTAIKSVVDANTKTYLSSLTASETAAALRDIATQLYYRSQYPEQFSNDARRIAPGTNERSTTEAIKERFDAAVLSAMARGSKIEIYKLDADARDGFFAVEGGSYSPGQRTIRLVVADLLKPSRSNLVSVLHEELHAMIANAPTYVQTALHKALASIDVTKLAQFNNKEADVRLQNGLRPSDMTVAQWLEENFVEDKAIRALDRAYTSSVFSKLLRRVKEIYYQSLAWIQQYLPSSVEPGVAEALIEARFERFAAGDYLSAFRGELGVVDRFRSTFEETATRLASVTTDHATGRSVFSDAAGETLAEVDYNTRIPREGLLRWTDSGVGDVVSLTAREGMGLSPAVVGRTLNTLNWSTVPSRGLAPTALFARPGRMEFAASRLLNRLKSEPEVKAADGKSIRILYPDNAQGGGELGRVRHFVYGKEGVAATTAGFDFSNQRVRVSGADKIVETLKSPILTAKTERGSTLYVSKYDFENGPRLHVVVVNEVVGRPYVETQYVVNVERLDPQLDATITQLFNSAQSISKDSSISTEAPSPQADQSGSTEGTLPEAGTGTQVGDVQEVNDLLYTVRGQAAADFQEQIALTEGKITSRARIFTSTYNQLIWRLSEVYNRVVSEEDRKKFTFEKFLIDSGLPNYSELKARAIEQASRELGRDVAVDGNLKVDDLTHVGEKDPAELMLATLTTKALARMDRRLTEANTEIVSGEAQFNKETDRMRGLYAAIRDKLSLRAEARTYVREQLDMLRRFVRKQADLTGRDAELRTTVESLEGGFDEAIYNTYSKLMERVPTDDTNMDSVIEQSLEIRQDSRFGAEMTPTEFLAAVQANLSRYPALEALLDPNRPGKASPLLAVVHRFMRSRELLSDQLRTAAFGADAQQRLAAGMKQIVENTNDTALDNIRREAAANMDGLLIRLFRGRQGERVVFAGVLRKYLASIERNRRLGRSIEQAKVSREYITNATPALRSLQSSIEQRLAAAVTFELVDNAPVIVPESINDTDSQLFEVGRRQTYRIATENATTNQQVVQWLKAQKRWLDARAGRPELQGKAYNTIKSQSERLLLHLQNEDPGKLRSGFMSGAYESITALLRNSGTRAGSIASSMWVRYTALPHTWASRDRENGRKFTAAVERLSAVTSLKSHISTDELFYQPMAHVFNTVPESVEIGIDLALQRVRLNPAAKLLLMKPGVEAAFRNLAKATLQNGSGWLKGKIDDVKLKVDDSAIISMGLEDEPVSLLRRQITRGVEGGTFPRQLSSRILQAVSHLRGKVSELRRITPDTNNAATQELTGAELTRQIISEGSENPALSQSLSFWTRFSAITPDRIEAVREVLKGFFDRQAVTDFIRPLVQNFESPSIPGPVLAEGQPPLFVDAATATAAWNTSGDDLIKFADNLLDVLQPQATPDQRNAYRGSVVQYFGRQFAKLSNLVSSQESTRVFSPLGVGHIAMDARIGEGFPAEFLDYMKFNEADQRSASNTIAINSSFGHDMRDLLRSYQTIDQEIDAQVQQLNSLRAEANAAGVKAADDKKLLKYLKENGINGQKVSNPEAWIAQRETATRSRNWFNFDKLGQLTGGLLKPESGFTGDLTLGVEVFDTILAGLLASPKSAVKNVSSIVDTITFFRSPGFASLRALKTGGISAIRNSVASAASVFGVDLLRNVTANRRFVAANVLDPERNLNLVDYFNEKGFNNSLELTRVGRMQARIRTARNLLTNYTFRLGDRSNTLSTPGFRASPTGIFSWSQQISNLAVAESILTEYDRIVNRALQLSEKNPGYLVDLRDGKLINGEDVGYRRIGPIDDRPAFEALQDHARQMGKPLEQLVLEAADLKSRGLDIFTADTVARMYSRAVTEVSLESSPTNNPAPMVGSSTGRVAFRLVRWSWAKQFKVFNLFKSQTGRADYQTALNGLMTMGLMVLPASLLLSIGLDDYDEKVTGKKSNVRELGGSLENTMYSILERMTITGGFGFAGDFTNGMLNNAGANIGGGSSIGGANAFSLDNRIVALSLLGNISQLSQKAFSQGFDNLTYATFYRQAAQTFGAGGALQYMQIINNVADQPVFDEEAKITARINAGNYLRAAGRTLKLELRAGGGSGTANAVTPYISDMALSAMTSDREGFLKAYRDAIIEARQMGKPDPVAYVKQAFSTRHPLRALFRTAPSPQEYRQMLQVMGEDGADAVQTALRNFSRFGLSLGIRPYQGSTTPRVATTESRDLDAYRRGLLED